MTTQKFNQTAVDANAMSKTRPNLDTLALLVEEVKAIRRAMGASAGGSGAGMLCGSVAWNPADLADGAGETSPNVTVTGAALGDFVICSVDIDLVGVTLTGYVSAANTVNARAQNESGAAYNTKDFGTLHVLVIPKAAQVSSNGAALAAMTLTQTPGTSS